MICFSKSPSALELENFYRFVRIKLAKGKPRNNKGPM